MSVWTAGNLLYRLEIGIRGVLRNKFVDELAFSSVNPAAVWKARTARIINYFYIWNDSWLFAVDCFYLINLLVSLNAISNLHKLRAL